MKRIINLPFFLLIIILFLSPKLSVVYSQETCEIYPDSFPYDFQGEIEIRASDIEKGKEYYLVLPTRAGGLTVTAVDDKLIKANLLADNSLRESGKIEVRRFTVLRTLICTVEIAVGEKPTPKPIFAPPNACFKQPTGNCPVRTHVRYDEFCCLDLCSRVTSFPCPPEKPYRCAVTEDLLLCCEAEVTCAYTQPQITMCDLCKCDTSTEPPSKTEQCPDCNEECESCISPGEKYEKGGSWTVFGCINTGSSHDFVAWVLARAMGIGGGVAFLLTILGAFQVITSAGDPDKVKAGKEMITAAISGLLLIIFSLFLLQLIGVKILNIPGFGG